MNRRRTSGAVETADFCKECLYRARTRGYCATAAEHIDTVQRPWWGDVETKMAEFTNRPLAVVREDWRLGYGQFSVELQMVPDEALNEMILRFHLRAETIRERQLLAEWIEDQLEGQDPIRDYLMRTLCEVVEAI